MSGPPIVPPAGTANERKADLYLFAPSRPLGVGPDKERGLVSLVVSFGGHIALGVVVLLLMRYAPHNWTGSPMQSIPFHDIVWLNQPGPGGGGGGGGNRMEAPPRKAEDIGKQKITVPVQKPPEPMPMPNATPKELPPPGLTIPAKAMADSNFVVPGALDGNGPAFSQGPGSGGGTGTGTGTGSGPGNGSGLGPGWGGGTGGGAYRPGSGIDIPRLVKEVRPQYTAEAMRAKIQGIVIVECVVLPDGTVGDAQIVKSLDPVFGLDQKALEAARQWRFEPGRKGGQPVPVLITIELTFTLR